MTHSDKDNRYTYQDIQRSGGDVATTFEFEPSRQKVRLRDHATFLPVDHISTCYECFDSLTSLYFLFPSVENLSPS